MTDGPPPLKVATSTEWRDCVVREIVRPSPRLALLRLELPDRQRHVPGQHYVVRLTAEDGYTASRSYSLASSPNDPLLELAVERLVEGEVSGYLTEVARPGDAFEVRGPIGGYFVWDATTPAICIGAATGVVPFVSMLRYAAEVGRRDLLRLVVAARTMSDLPYSAELIAAGATVALSREATDTRRAAGRLTAADLAPVLIDGATYFVCGSAVFAEAATQLLIAVGVPARAIKVERFGPSA